MEKSGSNLIDPGRTSRKWLLLAAILLVAQTISVEAELPVRDEEHIKREKEAAHASSLLSSNDRYAIHLFQRVSDNFTDGHLIAHIDKESDTFTRLFASGVGRVESRRISYRFTRLLGLLVQGDTLWLAYYKTPSFVTDSHDQRPGSSVIKKYLSPLSGQFEFVLTVDDLRSTAFLGQYQFNEILPFEESTAGFEEYIYQSSPGVIALKDHLGNGPLNLSGEDIRCFDYSFRIEDGKLRASRID